MIFCYTRIERVLFAGFSENTPPDASFTGSMQLLAGVKLCTDRHITNHPHYENKFLRERTKQVSHELRLRAVVIFLWDSGARYSDFASCEPRVTRAQAREVNISGLRPRSS